MTKDQIPSRTRSDIQIFEDKLISRNQYHWAKEYEEHSLKAVNDMVNDKNALSVNHTQLNLAESKSHSGIRAECILHMAVSIGVID